MSLPILKRTTSEDLSFQKLVSLLDADLAVRNGETNDFFSQFNKSDALQHVVVACDAEGVPVGCGAMKPYDGAAMEVKRMFVPAEMRGKRIAALVLAELESWARSLGYQKCVLETGDKMPEAIALYRRSGYKVIPNYGPYAGVESSLCFEKIL